MTRRILSLLAPAVLLLALSTTSFAGISPNGSFGFAISACCNLDGGPTGTGDILTATTIGWFNGSFDFNINTNDATTFGNPNNFQGLFGSNGDLVPDSVTTNGVDSISAFFPFPTNNYSFVSSSEIRTINVSTRSVSYYFLGTFHDSTAFYDDAAASLTLQFTQSAPNTSMSGSGTFSTPPVPFSGAPEPATMTLFGGALVGLGLIGRKRLAR